MTPHLWPSLQGWTPPHGDLVTRRAVYGKVHRAPTDYRWIAWSDGFGAGPSPLEQELALGSEDSGDAFFCWRCSAAGWFAVTCYPSRAFDAAGRRAGVEKQILATAGGVAVPPAALAFALLPEIAKLDDTVWWESWRDPHWQNLDHHLPIPAVQCPVLSFAEIESHIHQGVTELLAAVSEVALIDFYARLLLGSGPAPLRIQDKALTPLALAALLLPLDPPTAARLSIAGGFPSQTFEPKPLAQWSGVVCPSGVIVPDIPAAAALREDAERVVATLHRGLSSAARARGTAGATAPASSPGGTYMTGFLESPERWFAPGERGHASLAKVGPWEVIHDESERVVLRSRVAAFIAHVGSLEPGSFEQRHLATKADLLRALLLALCPGPESLKDVGLPTTGAVPALLFASRIEIRDWPELAQYGRTDFALLAEQSLRCRSMDLMRGAEEWLKECAGRQDLGALQQYAADALRQRSTSGSSETSGSQDSALLQSLEER